MRSLLFFTGLLACMQAASANQLEINFVRQMTDRINYAEQNQAAVWPGFHPAATASLIYVHAENQGETAHAYALNYKPGNLPWQKLETDANGNVTYYLDDASGLPANLEDGNMSNLENQTIFMDAETRYEIQRQDNFFNKFMLQRGSYYLLNQSQLDLGKLSQTDVHYDMFNKPDLVKLLYLEDAALNKAQQSDAVVAEEGLHDAVAIHQYRLSMMDKDAQSFENATEIIQGVPMFISMASRHLNDDDYRKLTQRNSCASLITGQGMEGISDCTGRGYPVYAAAVYGRALDKKMNDGAWKTELETQFKSASRSIIDYYHMTNAEAKTLTEKAMQKPQYNYARIVRTADYIMTPYLEGMAAAVKGYEQQAGIEFSAPDDWESVFNGGDDEGSNPDPYLVDILTNLYTNVKGVYILDGTDDGSQVNFKKLPYVYQKRLNTDDQAGNASNIIFKIDPDTIITLDGVQETAANLMNAKQKREFDSITMTGKYVVFTINRHGTLDASNGNQLKLNYKLHPGLPLLKKRK